MMAVICQKCGVTGYSELLIYCGICKKSAEHRYCLDELPDLNDKEVHWSCEQCKPRPCKIKSKSGTSDGKVKYLFRPVNTNRSSTACKKKKHKNSMLSGLKKDSAAEKTEENVPNGFHVSLPKENEKKRRKLILNEEDLLEEGNDTIPSPRYDQYITDKDENQIANAETFTQLQIHKHEAECIVNEKSKGRRRRRLILEEDEDIFDEEYQYNLLGANKPRLSSKYAKGLTNPPDEGANRLEIECSAAHTLAEPIVHVEDQDTELNRLGFECSKALTLAEPTVHVENQDAELNRLEIECSKALTLAGPIVHVENQDAQLNRLEIDCSKALTLPQTIVHVENQDARLNMPCGLETTIQPFYFPARPDRTQIWSGCFQIGDKEYGPLSAHLSTRACERVCNISKTLPPILNMLKISRLDSWPKSFQTSPPSDDNIALFFFPYDARALPVLNQLLADVIDHDLVLKVVFEEAELLIFSSLTLPIDYHKFGGGHYLWGVFKRREVCFDQITRGEAQISKQTKKRLAEARTDQFSDLRNSTLSRKQIVKSSKNKEKEEELELCEVSSSIDGTTSKREKEEGEISDNEIEKDRVVNFELLKDDDGQEEGIDECLNLFPLRVEDMKFRCRAGVGDDVDLDLGLRLPSGVDGSSGSAIML